MNQIFIAVLALFAGNLHALAWTENPKVAELFKAAGVQEPFVLYDPS